MKKALLAYACIWYATCTYNQTTIVYNVSSNTCSGTNMNCEGLVNSVGETVAWVTKTDCKVINHGTINKPQEIKINVVNKEPFKIIHTLIPTAGQATSKRIRVLFVTIPFSQDVPFNIPTSVANEIKDIVKTKGSNSSINYIIKVYRQFSSSNPTMSEWIEVMTLFVPKGASDQQIITLNPNGTATASSQNDLGEKMDLVIDLQKQY
jgi:hypothetical protein